ncbi:hypothetical protein GH714_043724 [Hevea brasiliensis]|uniref:CCHC-type domain-containing protein n=1 Tax=Hevea brasiliensis TaxID=3981 RepID=A0A6A6K3R3_HEVBR|nr:hypothetical protein GH714_043724 [Hevea brasiliensis]
MRMTKKEEQTRRERNEKIRKNRGEFRRTLEPTDDKEKAKWRVNNARVITWILNSVEKDIALSLRPFSTANEIWVHLQKLYSQPNHARLFEIEYEIARINQDDRDVWTFYFELIGLWTELDMVSMSLVDKSAYADLKKERDKNRVLQFLVKLRPEFENIRATIVNHGITDFDLVLGELLREETQVQTQANLDAKTNNVDTIFFASRSRPPMKKMIGENGTVQCRFCGEMWHTQSHCKKRNVCNYCKKKGHMILECHLLQRNKHNQAALFTLNGPAKQEVPNTTSINLTQDAIQQMIQSIYNQLF